jgi:hypothetical protein
MQGVPPRQTPEARQLWVQVVPRSWPKHPVSKPAARLVAQAATAGRLLIRCGPNANTMTGPQTAGRCPAATSVDADGPLVPTHVAQVGPNGNSWVFFPEGFGKDGMKLPVFNWGTPTNQGPAEFMGPLNRLASHGFVVISQVLTTSGSAAIDWILAENARSDSMFYQKLDPTRVGRGGTGRAAGQTFAEAKDPRLSLYVVVCGGNSGGGDAASPANFHAPAIIGRR